MINPVGPDIPREGQGSQRQQRQLQGRSPTPLPAFLNAMLFERDHCHDLLAAPRGAWSSPRIAGLARLETSFPMGGLQ
jgi:hypothetical protein